MLVSEEVASLLVATRGSHACSFCSTAGLSGRLSKSDLVMNTTRTSLQVEVLAVQLPGRAKRHKEPFAESLREVAEALLPVLRSRLEDPEVPYAVVGHSMGCWAAYELLVRVQACVLPLPTVF